MPNQLPNQTIDAFVLLRQLSDAAVFATWHARDTNRGCDVTLVLVSAKYATNVPDLVQQAEQLTHLRHAHLWPPYAVIQQHGQVAIATEQVASPTLAATLQARERLPWDEMLSLVEPLCQALDYLHAQGVMHTGIHPDVMYFDTERGVLLDGLMPAALASYRADFAPASTRLLAYQAPEVGQVGIIGPQADVYALGCLVYELLRGTPLFTGKTPADVQQAQLRGPRFPTSWPEKLPDELEAILGTAVAPDPAARYASAGAFYQALHNFTAATAQARQQIVPPSVLWRRVLPLLTWLLITLLVLGAIFVAVLWGR